MRNKKSKEFDLSYPITGNGFEDWAIDQSNIGKKLGVDIEKYYKLNEEEKSKLREKNKKENLKYLEELKHKLKKCRVGGS